VFVPTLLPGACPDVRPGACSGVRMGRSGVRSAVAADRLPPGGGRFSIEIFGRTEYFP